MVNKEAIEEFLTQSNMIEQVISEDADIDAKMAWDYASTKAEMTVPYLLDIHRILMTRLNPRIAGHIRHCDVWIGGKKKKFVTTYLIEENLNQLFSVLNKDYKKGEKQLEALSEEMHVMFEDIHPFEDGNGRVGRILWNWNRLRWGLPLKIVHVGPEQMEYYKIFRKK